MLDSSFTRLNLNKFGKWLYYLYVCFYGNIMNRYYLSFFIVKKWINVDYLKELTVSTKVIILNKISIKLLYLIVECTQCYLL